MLRLKKKLDVKKKLLQIKDFQSARYELWVAALCVAANFDIEYENEADNKSKHPEFIATDRETGIKIAVEAKSKHRKGVKGFSSGLNVNPSEKVNIRGLILEAYKKKVGLPLIIFIDVNLPDADERLWNKWMKEIESTIHDLFKEGYEDPCPANIVFFHNDPSHYLCHEKIGNESDSLWISNFIPEKSEVPCPDIQRICERLIKAHNQRARPPLDFFYDN